ncbi:hypothetical protein [Clostridium sp. C8]|uniref:hypothetical protein n=1 Tax=Clostridium sp. C8 TaxID=1667357 RepID=UPI00062E8534|nr:hypothetical protein [Clostridium sp. C8]KLE15494.1 hypothetical protein AAT22_11190 [Clostridium sp. C8]
MNYYNNEYENSNYEEYFKGMNNREEYPRNSYQNNLSNAQEDANYDFDNAPEVQQSNLASYGAFQRVQGAENFQNLSGAQNNQWLGGAQGMQNQCGQNVIQRPGQVRRYNSCYNINGRNYVITNRNFYNRYFTRYNHIYVNNCNHIKDFLRDCNIYHFTNQTIYEGCQYLGSNTVVANNWCGNNNNSCCNNNVF